MSQPSVQPPPQPAPGGTALGCALFAIGLVMVVPSGLCTAIGGFMLVTEIVEGGGEQLLHNLGDFAPFVALTLIPLVVGGFLLWAGLRVRRQG